MDFPVKVAISKSIKVTCVLFSVFFMIIGYGIVIICSQQIYMEDDTLVPWQLKALIACVALLVETGIGFMIFPIWHRILSKRGAMTLTKKGIEDTFLMFNILAFWTIFRVRIIPWEAVCKDELADMGIDLGGDIDVDTSKLPKDSANAVARFMLRITGFNHTIGKITSEEIIKYRDEILQTNMDTQP